MSRIAGVALVFWAVVNALWAVVKIGRYEDRLVNVNHDDPDLALPWFIHEYLDELLRPNLSAEETAETLLMWGFAAAAVIVCGWVLLRKGKNWTIGARFAGITAVSLIIAWLYDLFTAKGGVLKGTFMDTRLVAYTLWLALATVNIVVAVGATRKMTSASR